MVDVVDDVVVVRANATECVRWHQMLIGGRNSSQPVANVGAIDRHLCCSLATMSAYYSNATDSVASDLVSFHHSVQPQLVSPSCWTNESGRVKIRTRGVNITLNTTRYAYRLIIKQE
jgi:hypothetical protein